MSISNPELVINGEPIAIVANSFKYDEGTSAKNVRAAVVGTVVTQDFSEDFSEAFSTFSFQVHATVDILEKLRQFEALKNTNTVSATGVETVAGVEQTWARSFTGASISEKPELPLGFDSVIEVNWKADAAV